MKYSISILVSILLTLECYGQSVKYFRDCIFDERTYTLKMIFPLNLEVAKKTNCYCAKYDKMGRLTSYYFMKNGKAQENSIWTTEAKIEYQGNIQNISLFNVTYKPQYISSFERKLSIQRNYKNNQIVVKRFNKDNILSRDNDGISIYIYTLNSRGWIVKEQYQNERGEFIAKTDSCLNIVYKWTEDKVSFTSDASYQYSKNIRMSSQNRVVRLIKTYDKQSLLNVNMERFEYEKDSVDIVKKTATVKYDSNGNIEEVKRNRYENDMYDGFYYYSAQYDKYGNISKTQKKQSFTFQNGRKVFFRNGEYVLINVNYYSKGSVSKYIYCNANGEVIDIGKGYSVHECIYDNSDRVIEERYYDKLNNLIDANADVVNWNDDTKKYSITTKTAAIIKSEYRDTKIIKRRYYNAKNELISEE